MADSADRYASGHLVSAVVPVIWSAAPSSRDMVHGLLAELDDHNCWTTAE